MDWDAHHARLVLVETDPDEVIELLELAVTWSELAYDEALVIPPERWTDFAGAHHWHDPVRVHRLFSLATDIAFCRHPAGVTAGRIHPV